MCQKCAECDAVGNFDVAEAGGKSGAVRCLTQPNGAVVTKAVKQVEAAGAYSTMRIHHTCEELITSLVTTGLRLVERSSGSFTSR